MVALEKQARSPPDRSCTPLELLSDTLSFGKRSGTIECFPDLKLNMSGNLSHFYMDSMDSNDENTAKCVGYFILPFLSISFALLPGKNVTSRGSK